MSSCHLKCNLSRISSFPQQHSKEAISTTDCIWYWQLFSVTFPLQEMIVPNNVIDLPPPSPPKPKTIVLPPNWKVARDPEGKIYYYHIVTRLVFLYICEGFVTLENTCTSDIAFLCVLGRHSGTLQPGKEVARTLAWTMNQRWTSELPLMMRILPRWALSSVCSDIWNLYIRLVIS